MKTLLLSVFFTFSMSHNTCVRNPGGGGGGIDTVFVVTEKRFIYDTTISYLTVDSVFVINQQLFSYDTTISYLTVDSVFVVDSLFTVYMDTVAGVIVDPSLVKHQPVNRVWVQWTQGGPFTPYYLKDSIR